MLAGGEDCFGQFKMGGGGGDDAERLGGKEGLVEGGESRDLILFGNLRGLLRRNIMHAGKTDLSRRGQPGINAGVFLAKGTDPEHGNLELVRHANEFTVYELRLTSLNCCKFPF